MKKKVIIGIFVILIIVLIVFFMRMWRPAYLKIENRSSQAVPQHGMPTLTEKQYCITDDGDSYLIDYEQLWHYHDGKWSRVKINAADMLTSEDFADMAEYEDSFFLSPFISAVADHMVPVSEGVAFSCSYRVGYGYYPAGLYYTSGEDASLISKNADAFCTDGEQVYYYDTAQKRVFSFDGEQTQAYFDIPLIDDSPYYVDRMLANEDWILIIATGDFYQYSRKTGELSINQADALTNLSNDPSVLYDDKLVQFSKAQSELTIFDLVTGEEKNTDFYAEAYAMGIHAKIISALHGDYIYLSIYNLLDSWGKPFECTVKIHRQTDEVDIINDEYYENLLCTDTALYGGKIHRMTKICEFE